MLARIRAFAKLNLCLEVLNKRPDGFHNLRTVFQTISLHDTIAIEAKRSHTTSIQLESNIEIPGENLVARAADAVLAATGLTAKVRFQLKKRIPMGGGLGGGSADAASVLVALPRMLGTTLPEERLIEIGTELGSDVPFFLVGGTAAGLGRGTELYPLPDAPSAYGVLLTPAVHVSTAEAYRALGRSETFMQSSLVSATERLAFSLAAGGDWAEHCVNDFEAATFHLHPELGVLRDVLEDLGARPARMTGSGAALFGLFATRSKRDSAIRKIDGTPPLPFRFVSRRRYRTLLNRSLHDI